MTDFTTDDRGYVAWLIDRRVQPENVTAEIVYTEELIA